MKKTQSPWFRDEVFVEDVSSSEDVLDAHTSTSSKKRIAEKPVLGGNSEFQTKAAMKSQLGTVAPGEYPPELDLVPWPRGPPFRPRGNLEWIPPLPTRPISKPKMEEQMEQRDADPDLTTSFDTQHDVLIIQHKNCGNGTIVVGRVKMEGIILYYGDERRVRKWRGEGQFLCRKKMPKSRNPYSDRCMKNEDLLLFEHRVRARPVQP